MRLSRFEGGFEPGAFGSGGDLEDETLRMCLKKKYIYICIYIFIIYVYTYDAIVHHRNIFKARRISLKMVVSAAANSTAVVITHVES